MTLDTVVDLMVEMLWLAATCSAPMLLSGLVVGLVVSIFQAATQLQEQAISFIPKLLAVGGALVFTAPWLLERLTRFASVLFEEIARMGPGI
ncbi:MAG: flagellar biosynthesis protein FliQ [Myxococcota bacterium]